MMSAAIETAVSSEVRAPRSSPIGLDLGARTPEETAVSIAADIIARRWGGGGRRLAEIAGRIHRDTQDAQVEGELNDYLTQR